jgi:hypothetical protein
MKPTTIYSVKKSLQYPLQSHGLCIQLWYNFLFYIFICMYICHVVWTKCSPTLSGLKAQWTGMHSKFWSEDNLLTYLGNSTDPNTCPYRVKNRKKGVSFLFLTMQISEWNWLELCITLCFLMISFSFVNYCLDHSINLKTKTDCCQNVRVRVSVCMRACLQW